MDRYTLVRAWRDPVFRASLPVESLLELPKHPAGDPFDDESDWSVRLSNITLGDGCETAGCTRIICTDPCGTFGSCLTDACKTIAGPCDPYKTWGPNCTAVE